MFWEKFCSLCISKGKAPNVVASEIGIKSSGTVTGWKNGAIPRVSILRKLSDYFGVPVEYFTSEIEQKNTPTTQMDSEDVNLAKLIEIAKNGSPEMLQDILNYARVRERMEIEKDGGL